MLFRSLHLWIQCRVPAHYHGWVSPFGNPRIKDCSASPRGLSQPSTSFIGSRCQGIHRVPLFSYLIKNTNHHYAVIKERAAFSRRAAASSREAARRAVRAGP